MLFKSIDNAIMPIDILALLFHEFQNEFEIPNMFKGIWFA